MGHNYMHANGNNYMHVNGCDSINTVKREGLLATPFLNETWELLSFIPPINPYFLFPSRSMGAYITVLTRSCYLNHSVINVKWNRAKRTDLSEILMLWNNARKDWAEKAFTKKGSRNLPSICQLSPCGNIFKWPSLLCLTPFQHSAQRQEWVRGFLY